jgi:DNA polymerase III sliding clamp (beta) subunit (PCNA family)
MKSQHQNSENIRVNHLRLVQETISVKDLRELLKRLKPIIPKRPSHPILGCVKLESANGVLKATATDLSNFIVVKTPCDLTFSALANYELITNWLEACPETMELYLETSEEEGNGLLHIRTDKFHYQFNFVNFDLFPELAEETEPIQPKTVRFEYEPMMNILKSAEQIASKDETKSINKVCVIIESGKATIKATDGHVLVEQSLNGEGEDCKFLVNKKLISILSRLHGSHITFQISTDTIDVTVGNTTIAFFLRKEDYPSFAHLEGKMPTSDEIIVDRKSLMDAIKRCGGKPDKNNEDAHKLLLTAYPGRDLLSIEGIRGVEQIAAQILGNNPSVAVLDVQLLNRILQSIRQAPQVLMQLGRNEILTLVKPTQTGHYGLMGYEVECKLPYELQDDALIATRAISFEATEIKEGRTRKVTHEYQPAIELPYEWRNGQRIVTRELKESWQEWNPKTRRSELKTVHFLPEQLPEQLSIGEIDEIPTFDQFFSENSEVPQVDEEIPTFGAFFTN